MDYGKLSKPTLIEMCEAKKIPYSSSFSKDKLIDLLIEADLAAKKSTPAARPAASSNDYDDSMYDTGPATLGKVGGILSLIYYGFCSFIALGFVLLALISAIYILLSIVMGYIGIAFFWMIMGVISVTYIAFAIIGLIFSIKYVKGTAGSKVAAGIFGILAGLLPGIFIFMSDYRSIKELEEN